MGCRMQVRIGRRRIGRRDVVRVHGHQKQTKGWWVGVYRTPASALGTTEEQASECVYVGNTVRILYFGRATALSLVWM